MNSLALSLATFACSLSLALPPGWCCMLAPSRVQTGADQVVQQAEESAPTARRSCCHRGVAGPQTGLAPTATEFTVAQPVGGCQHQSRTPQVRCCCTRDAVVREKAVDAPADALSVALVTEAAPLAAAPCVSQPQHVFPSLGPPLHVLQCVWRC